VAPDDSIGFFLQATGLRGEFDEVMEKLNRHAIELPDDSRCTQWDLLDVLNDGVDFFPITGDQMGPGGERDLERPLRLRGRADVGTQGPHVGDPAEPEHRHGGKPLVGGGVPGLLRSDLELRPAGPAPGIVREAPLYGGSLGVDYLTTCIGYGEAEPHPVPRPEQHGPPIPGIISNSTHDGETPYGWAVDTARTYPTMRAVTVVGGIHGTFGLSQSGCVDDTIGDVLISATPPSIDVACAYSPPGPAP
jgi:hypothetical protein